MGREKGGGAVAVTVKPGGTGIPPRYLGRLVAKSFILTESRREKDKTPYPSSFSSASTEVTGAWQVKFSHT